VVFRPQIQRIVERAALAGRDHIFGAPEADPDQIAAVLRHPEARQRRVLRNHRGDEIFALEAAPGDVGPKGLVGFHLGHLGPVDALGDVGDGAVVAVAVRRSGGIDILVPRDAAVLVQRCGPEILQPDLHLEAVFVRAKGIDFFNLELSGIGLAEGQSLRFAALGQIDRGLVRFVKPVLGDLDR